MLRIRNSDSEKIFPGNSFRMAQQRPHFIALPSPFSAEETPQGSPSLPSPRIQHVAGDVAPAMSPLDAFAMQSRALAKQLDETRVKGRRVSRLPPFKVADELAKKAHYFRSGSLERRERSQERKTRGGSPDESVGNTLDIEESTFRPKSYYPRLSKIDHTPDETPMGPDGRSHASSNEELFITPMEHTSPTPAADYFGTGRVPSPEPVAQARPSMESMSRPSYRSQKSFDSISQRNGLERGLSMESSPSKRSQYSNGRALIPPVPPYVMKAPSIRSVESDEDNPGMTPSSSLNQHRKLSSSSGFSLPQSPAIAHALHHNRSASGNSDMSSNGARTGRAAFNFSRPMSRNSRPSMDASSRMSSTERHPQIYYEEEAQTPLSIANSAILPRPDEGGDCKDQPGASYTYSKFALPRGRALERSSTLGDGWFVDEPDLVLDLAATPSTTSLPTPPHSLESDTTTRSSFESAPASPPPMPASGVEYRYSLSSMNTTNTGNSGSTIKASQQNTIPPAAEMTAEDHLNKGIECHERGSLNESTYHLRLAARQNNPTAMLLYALACRHGWGMRPNQAEGVAWLRKAMDCASIELTHDTTPNPYGAAADVEKTRRAQFALSVYELGVSHMNGWGIEQDKSLALRCFEIASSWGDGDAMAEAGFCYAQGIGCKKDLRKAAKYYRMAEAKGVSMVGNSW